MIKRFKIQRKIQTTNSQSQLIYWFQSHRITKKLVKINHLLFLLGGETHEELHLLLVPLDPDLLAERRLQNQRNIREVGTVDDPPKSVQPDGSLSNVVVSVSVAASRAQAVVDVTAHKPLPSNLLPEVPDQSVEALLAAEVVASGHGVAGVQADSDPLLVLH